MAVKIKLKRIGKMREPHYRIVVADARTARGGRAIEEIGQYHPLEDPSRILVDSERAQYWLGVGAQPTEAVAAILRVTGDWQQFKGEPAPAPMLVAEPKADKKTIFEAAAKEAAGLEDKAATTPKAKKKAVAKDSKDSKESKDVQAAEPKDAQAAEPKDAQAAEPKGAEAAAPDEPQAATESPAAAAVPAADSAADATAVAEPAADSAAEPAAE